MSQITIRNLDPEVKKMIRTFARLSGRTMEGHIRLILTEAVGMGTVAAEKLTSRNNILGLVKEHLELAHAANQLRDIKEEAKKARTDPL